MSRLINVADDVYAELLLLKKIKKASFTEVIREFVEPKEKKTEGPRELLAHVHELEEKLRGRKKENVSENIDKLLYGG